MTNKFILNICSVLLLICLAHPTTCQATVAPTKIIQPIHDEKTVVNPHELTKDEQNWIKENPSFSVGAYSLPPYIIVNGEEGLSGYLVEVLQAISDQVGLQPDFRSETVFSTAEGLRNGTLDAGMGLTYSSDHNSWLAYSSPTAPIVHTIFARTERTELSDLTSLSSKTIATIKGGALNEILKHYLPEANIIRALDYVDTFRLVSEGKADAVIQERQSGEFLLRNNLIGNVRAIANIHFGGLPKWKAHYYGVRKEMKLLISILDKGWDSMPPAQKQTIWNRWFRPKEQSASNTFALTVDEQAWLSDHPVVRVPIIDFPPYLYWNDGPQGIAVDLLELVSKKAGFEVSYSRRMSRSEGLEAVRTHEKGDLLLGVEQIPERESSFGITRALGSFPLVIFSREEEGEIYGLEALAGKIVSIEESFMMVDVLQRRFPQIELLLCEGDDEALQAVSNGGATAYVGALTLAQHHIGHLGLNNLKVAAGTGLDNLKLAIAVRKDWPELVSVLNKGLSAISQQERNTINRKYFIIDVNKKIDYRNIGWWLLGVVSLFLIILFWNRLLQQQVAERTAKLNDHKANLENEVKARTMELKEQKERLQTITENVPGVVFQFYANKTGESGFHYSSPKLYEIFGLECIEDPALFLQTFIQNIYEEDRQSWVDSFREVIDKQIPWKWKGRYLKPSGEIIWFEGHSTPTIRQSEIVFDGIFIDITEKIEHEEQRLRTIKKQEQFKKFESLRTMAGAIAHRFNNSMMAVEGALELMMLTLPSESSEHELASNAKKAASGASQIGSMMLSYVGQTPLKLQDVSMETLARESLIAIKNTLKPSISLRFSPPIKPLYCSIDQRQMTEVIISIITNANDSLNDQPGTIEISFGSKYFTMDSFPIAFQDELTKDNEYIFCQIKDSGHGINQHNLSRVFEPFYTTKFVGRGLGLALTVGIMKAHHGAITIESTPNVGTTVRVLLPAAPSPQYKKIPFSDDTGTTTVEFSGNILLADDEPILLICMKQMIEQLGFTVHTVDNGRKAVDMVRRQHIDFSAIILDVSMPEMTGIEAMKEIRKINATLPVIFATGFSKNNTIFQGSQKDKPDGFLIKPLSVSDIQSSLEKLLF